MNIANASVIDRSADADAGAIAVVATCNDQGAVPASLHRAIDIPQYY